MKKIKLITAIIPFVLSACILTAPSDKKIIEVANKNIEATSKENPSSPFTYSNVNVENKKKEGDKYLVTVSYQKRLKKKYSETILDAAKVIEENHMTEFEDNPINLMTLVTMLMPHQVSHHNFLLSCNECESYVRSDPSQGDKRAIALNMALLKYRNEYKLLPEENNDIAEVMENKIYLSSIKGEWQITEVLK